MRKRLKRITASCMAVFLLFSNVGTTMAAAEASASEVPVTEIVASDMSLESAKSNVQQYYANEEWEQVYPDGLFVIEYASYEAPEGGTDPEHPEDFYLGIVVYRIGGTRVSSTVTYTLSCMIGDSELYPAEQGTIEFEPQQTKATAKIKIHNDDKRNGNQLLVFSLLEATTGVISDASVSAIKVFDDEPYVESIVQMSATQTVTDKYDGNVEVVLKRTESDTEYCTLKLVTTDGTAKAGIDYQAVEQEIVFAPGVTEQSVVIPLIQSVEQFTDTRYFTLSMQDLKGCKSAGTESIRLDITNVLAEDAPPLTVVEDEADLTVDDSQALSDTANSVVNINDTIDRAKLLQSVIGAVNGTAVQALPNASLRAAANTVGYWSPTVTVTKEEFEQRYCTDGRWTSDSSYNNGNEDLLITSKNYYNLNYFDSVTASVRNEEYLANGNPNTAFGYLTYAGASDTNNKFTFIKSDLTNASESNLNWMHSKQLYFLRNWNNSNINYVNSPITCSFMNGNDRYAASAGIAGAKQKLFYMAYDDEGWDDHHFAISDTKLNRTVIPFRAFKGKDVSNFKVNLDTSNKNKSTITFTMNNYDWTLSVDDSLGGGVGTVPAPKSSSNEDKYGFYVGSHLNVEFITPTVNIATPSPQYLYLTDDKGVIHNTSKVSNETGKAYFSIAMETLFVDNVDTLTENYYMTGQQANTHINDIQDAKKCINSTFNGTLNLEVSYVQQQKVVINFANMPVLKNAKLLSNGLYEDESSHAKRVYSALKDVIQFYGVEESPEYAVDLKNHKLVYDACDFKYMIVNPEAAGAGNRLGSNLYDLDFEDFQTASKLTKEECVQIDDDLIFTMYSENTQYLDPQISLQSFGVSSKTETGFALNYMANDLDSYIPFEALYHDMTEHPEITYYTVRFTISDIYTGNKRGAAKDFNVNVNYTDRDGKNSSRLFSFNFKGGAGFSEAADAINIKNFTEAYTRNDSLGETTIKENQIDVNGYKPVVELLDYTANGYEYIMYIPTYYNYQNSNDTKSTFYKQIFRGNDGISIEINHYDKNPDGAIDYSASDNGQAEVIATALVSETKHICTKMPSVVTDSESEGAQSQYFEQQKQFYTYNNEVTTFNLSGINVDFSAVSNAIARMLALDGNKQKANEYYALPAMGFYVKYGQNQIIAGFKVTGNFLKAYNNEHGTTKGVFFADQVPLGANGAANASESIKANNAGLGIGSVTGGFDIKAQWDYNTITHEFDFSKFSVALNAAGGVSVNLPIAPTGGVVYATFSTTFSVAVSTGFSFVKEYVDSKGVTHYSASWDGLTLDPALSASAGLGVGLAGLLAVEGGITATLSGSVTFGKRNYATPQVEYDIDSSSIGDNRHSMQFNGAWETINTQNLGDMDYGDANYYNGCYNTTVCQSYQVGDTLTIHGTGTAFHLTGSKNATGGLMHVKILDENGNVLKQTETPIDMRSKQTSLYETVFFWEAKNYRSENTKNTKFTAVIEHVSRTGNGEAGAFESDNLTLDSIRIYNRDYGKDERTFASFNRFTSSLTVWLKFCILGFSINLEPGYMMTTFTNKNASITLGTIGYSKTWTEPILLMASADEDIPVVLATEKRTASQTSEKYFDLGEFGETKSKELLIGDIAGTSKTQVIQYQGDIYSFYTVSKTDTNSGAYYYQLQYSKNDVEMGAVSDEVFVADFHAFIDGQGKLAVEMTTADSTVSPFSTQADGFATTALTDGSEFIINNMDDISKMLERTCVKVATFDGNAFTKVQVIEGTDGEQVQQSIPVAVANQNSVLFFVNDKILDGASASVNLNWDAYNDTDQMMANLMNALYKGQAEVSYSILKDGSYTVAQTISLSDLNNTEEPLKNKLKNGFKITSMDAVMADENTVCLAYAVEIPHAVTGENGYKGTQKEIHYKLGKIREDLSGIDFGETIIVDAVFDYDKNVSEIYEDLSKAPSKYYNKETGDIYDNIILTNVQLENAVICENGEAVSETNMQPCLFYQTNASINYVTYDTLQQVEQNKNAEVDKAADAKTFTAGVLYDGYFDNYIIAVSQQGSISLIYNNPEDIAYTDTLNMIAYNPEDQLWNKPRQLTYSEVFSQEDYDNHKDTASVSFDNYSAFINADGDVAIAVKSSYIPFSYDYVTDASMMQTDTDVKFEDYYDGTYVNSNGEMVPCIVTPVLDTKSEKARTDIFLITFEDMVTEVDVTNFHLTNEIFVPGEDICTEFYIHNTGDYMIEEMLVSLYYYNLETNANRIITQKSVTGTLLSGDSCEFLMEYTVDDNLIADNTILGVKITDASGKRVFYDSYEDCYTKNHDSNALNDKEATYHFIQNNAELYFEATNVQIDSDGIMTYKVKLGNCGTRNAVSDATVYCKAYTYDETMNDYQFNRTMFSFSVGSHKLDAGTITLVTGTFDVSQYMQNEKMYYAFEVFTEDNQYTIENDSTEVAVSYQTPVIMVNSIRFSNQRPTTDGYQVRYMKLGDEIEIQSSVLSAYYTDAQVVGYEVGSQCLSIENSGDSGLIKVKAIGIPNNSEGYAKLLVNIQGTTIFRYMYLYISNTDIRDFDAQCFDTGWNESKDEYVHAAEYDIVTTNENDAHMDFTFRGDEFRIFGDYLECGGDFELCVTNLEGTEVVHETISTAAELDNRGMLLYKSEQLPYDTYNACIRAVLEEGEVLNLDYAKFRIDTSNADVTPYPTVEQYEESLDLPMLSGRARQAEFTLTFSDAIALAEGKNFSDITLDFKEYESLDGTYVETGEVVTFTASEIREEKILVFTATLSSKPGCVLKYQLQDSELPADCIVSKVNTAIRTRIPNYASVSYELKESGIMSVVVAEDSEMPDGSVQKSVHVKFMASPNVMRLRGTKLLYTTQDMKGEEHTIAFTYSGLQEDRRVAVYRAERLELEAEELSKTFSFKEGIKLNEKNYVLVTAAGDYLENDITTVISDSSQLDIVYEKLRAEETSKLEVITTVSEAQKLVNKPALYLDFAEAVDSVAVLKNQAAYVEVQETITDCETKEQETNTIRLYLSESLQNDSTLLFSADTGTSYDTGKTVTYTIVSEAIQYQNEQDRLNCQYDGIAINPALPAIETLSFNTDAYVVSAIPYFAEPTVETLNSVFSVDVEFYDTVQESTLEGTTVTVKQKVWTYENVNTKTLALSYVSAKTETGEQGDYTVATYQYRAKEDVSAFAYEEIEKEFTIDTALGVPENQAITNVDGTAVYSTAILQREELSMRKPQADSAKIRLVENGEMGYHVALDVHFDEAIAVTSLGDVYVLLNMETDGETKQLYMELDGIDNQTLTFITTSAMTFNSGDMVTFTVPKRFTDALGSITNQNGTAVSEIIEGLATLVQNFTIKGKVIGTSLEVESVNKNSVKVKAEILYNDTLRELSFKDATIDIMEYIEYAGNEIGVVTQQLTFEELKDEKTAVFTAELELPVDSEYIQLTLGDTITVNNSEVLYNTNKTIALSRTLLDTKPYTIEKERAITTLAFGAATDGQIQSIQDTVLAVTFPDVIHADHLDGISLTADVNGIEGITQVRYYGTMIYNERTIIFVPEQIDGVYSNVVTVSVKNARMIFDENAVVYNANTNYPYAASVPDIEQMFYVASAQEKPTPTEVVTSTQAESDTEQQIESSTEQQTDSQDTTESESTTPMQTEPQSTDEVPPTDEADTSMSATEDEDVVGTGDDASVGIIIAVMFGALVLFFLLGRKNGKK